MLAQIAASAAPAAVLVTSSPEGKEIAARLAVKLGSGIITDAVDVADDLTTTQSVFAGGYTVTAKVTRGTPVITVKPNAVTPEPAPSTPVEVKVERGRVRRGQGGEDHRPAAACRRPGDPS